MASQYIHTVSATHIDQIRREHAQMLIEEVNVAVVNSLGNLLANLVRRTALDHVQVSPARLRVSTSGGTDEEAVLELSLQVVLLDMVGESQRNLPRSARKFYISSLRAA